MLYEYHSESSVLCLYSRIPKNTESDISTPCITFLQTRKLSRRGTLPFIWELWFHAIQWEWRNEGLPARLLWNFEHSHSSLSTWTTPISVPLPLKGGYYLAYILARLGMTFYSLRCLSSPGVISLELQILRFCKTQVYNTWWKYIFFSSHLQIESRYIVHKKWIQIGISPHLVCNTCWMVQWFPKRIHMCYLCSAQN